MNDVYNHKTRKSGSLFFPTQTSTSPLTTVHINECAIEHNLQQYKSIVGPSVRLAPVIKSNAYGHGILQIAHICEKNINVEMLCVASLTEAIVLRQHGVTKPILVLNIIDNYLEHVIDNAIEITLYDMRIAQELHTIAQKRQIKVHIHLKIDTGLSRLGILWYKIKDFVQQLIALPYITIYGIFTHFAESENQDQTFTNIQLERFNNVIETCESLGISIPIRHTACSAALTANTSSHCNLVRLGIGMYGLWPSEDNQILTLEKYPQFSLIPALTWTTTIIQTKIIPAGSYVGYDRTFQTKKELHIAILAAGYWEGIDRHLSNKGHVLIHNILAPIIGRIAMNTMMVDITHITNVQVGDAAILLGNYPGITAQDIAQHCNTINYEVITRINPLLTRFIT